MRLLIQLQKFRETSPGLTFYSRYPLSCDEVCQNVSHYSRPNLRQDNVRVVHIRRYIHAWDLLLIPRFAKCHLFHIAYRYLRPVPAVDSVLLKTTCTSLQDYGIFCRMFLVKDNCMFFSITYELHVCYGQGSFLFTVLVTLCRRNYEFLLFPTI